MTSVVFNSAVLLDEILVSIVERTGTSKKTFLTGS